MNSVKKSGVNPDLVGERKKCSFKTADFTNWWYGGEKNVEKKRWIGKYFSLFSSSE